jgi:hypothetical protein
VPAEVERLRRRIARRDQWFIGLVVASAVIAIVIALVVGGHGSTNGSSTRCVSFSHPNFTGGASYKYCGQAAVVFCRHPVPSEAAILAQCERLGLRPKRTPVPRASAR